MKTDISKQRVNYDAIAHLYDEPLRDHEADENLRRFLAERPLPPAQLRILDMGCGTGKQLVANQLHFPDMVMIGMDLFAGMLRQAQKRERAVLWVQGDNTAVPFPANSFHYITNQFSYPHVQDKARFIRETYRLLKPDGRFVMTNLDPWLMPGWAIYRYFPAAFALDKQDFLPAEAFAHLMREVGYSNIQISRQHYLKPEPLPQFLTYASERHRASEFMAIYDADYAAGLEAIKGELAQAGDKPINVDSEVCLITISGDKPNTHYALRTTSAPC